MDILIIQALRGGDDSDGYIDPDNFPELTEGERQAVDDLGPDFIRNLLEHESLGD